MNKKEERTKNKSELLVILSIVLFISFIYIVSAAVPEGPDSFVFGPNTTKGTVNSKPINVSGGYIAQVNVSATIQDQRWKAFVGNILGTFTLQDATGSKIYDWSISTLSGRLYVTRNDTGVSWTTINCSNLSVLETENTLMNHTNPDDNISKTFNTTAGATHAGFYVSTRYMTADTCPTLNTYKSNTTQDSDFEEMALYDGYSSVFSTILENKVAGYNGHFYDYQIMVPENGLPSFTGSTLYYLYVEIGT